MRLAPKSLAGQLTLLLVLALAVAQAVAIALFAWERIEALRDAHRENAVTRTATVWLYPLVSQLPSCSEAP